MSDEPKEVPLIEQLRSIPADYRTVRTIQWDEEGRETGHQFIPVGFMMHRAAAALEAAEQALKRCQEGNRVWADRRDAALTRAIIPYLTSNIARVGCQYPILGEIHAPLSFRLVEDDHGSGHYARGLGCKSRLCLQIVRACKFGRINVHARCY